MKKKRKTARRKKATKRKATKTKRRPNPNERIIGDAAMELTYSGGEGKRKGDMSGPWVHEFESGDVEIIGGQDGSIRLRSRSGKRLWDLFEVER